MLDFFRNGKENKTENAFMYGSFTTWMMCAVLISLTKKKKATTQYIWTGEGIKMRKADEKMIRAMKCLA